MLTLMQCDKALGMEVPFLSVVRALNIFLVSLKGDMVESWLLLQRIFSSFVVVVFSTVNAVSGPSYQRGYFVFLYFVRL